MDRRYAVVAFIGEDKEEGETIAVVPVKWIDKPNDKITDMFWPPKSWPVKGSRPVHLKRAIKTCIEPNIHWPLLKGSVLHLYREYDDAVKGLKRAENDTSLETEVDNAPRKRKPPKRYIDSTSTDENEENNMLPKKKNPRRTKISRKLSESDDESESDTLPQVNSDILDAVKKNICHIYEVENKVREKAHKRQSDENTVRVRVLQEFPSNCRQDEQKQRQQKKIDHGQCKSNVKSNDKYEKQKKMDRNKQNFVSITMANKNSVKFTNSKTSSVLSPIKDKVISGKTSKINSPDEGSSCSSQNPSCLEVQTSTCSASFERHFDSLSNVEASRNNNNTYSISLNDEISCKTSEEEAKSQVESSFNLKSKGDEGCKLCCNEVKLSSTVLLEVSQKLDSILINQAIILRSVNSDYATFMTPSNIPSIPLKTKEDFEKMETFLATNRINYEAVRDLLHSKCATALGAISIPSERSFTGNVLSKLISNGLAKLISWSGSEGDKTKFSDTKLCEVVFSTVKLRFPDSFLTNAEAKIKRWFQTANGRKVYESYDSDI